MAFSFNSGSQLLAPATTSPPPLPSIAAANTPEVREVVAEASIKVYQRRSKQMKNENSWVPETPVKPAYPKRRICKLEAESEADHDITVVTSPSKKEKKDEKSHNSKFSCLRLEVLLGIDGCSGNSLLESEKFNHGGSDSFIKDSNEGLVDSDVTLDNSSELSSYPSAPPQGECAIDGSSDVSFRGSDISSLHHTDNFLPEIHKLSNSLPLTNESKGPESSATDCDQEKDCTLEVENEKLHPVDKLVPPTPLIKHNKRPRSGSDANPTATKKSKIKKKRHRPKVAVDGVPRRPILPAKKEKVRRVKKTQPKGKKKGNAIGKSLKTDEKMPSPVQELPSIHSTHDNLTVIPDLNLEMRSGTISDMGEDTSVLQQAVDDKIVIPDLNLEMRSGTISDMGEDTDVLQQAVDDKIVAVLQSSVETGPETVDRGGEPGSQLTRYTLRIRGPKKELYCQCMACCGHKKPSKLNLEDLIFPKWCKRRKRMKRKMRSKVSIILNFFLLKGHMKKKRSKRSRPRGKVARLAIWNHIPTILPNFTYHGPEFGEYVQFGIVEKTLIGETKGMEQESVSNPSKQLPIGDKQTEVNYQRYAPQFIFSNTLMELLNPLKAQNHATAGEIILSRIIETGAVVPNQNSLSTKTGARVPSHSSRSHKTGARVSHPGFLSPKKGAIVPYLGSLSITEGAIVPHEGSPCSENGALVPHQSFLSPKKGAIVIHHTPVSAKKIKPMIDMDPVTMRRWIQIRRKEDGLGEEEEDVDAETERQWEKDRKLFRVRLDLFTRKMHLALGNRRFKQWKGSVVDSVVGVFLTQNVSDFLSSNAYMALAAKYPNERINEEEFNCSQESNGCTNGTLKDSLGPQYIVTTYDEESLVDIEDIGKPILPQTSCRNENVVNSETLSDIETSFSRMHLPNFNDFYHTLLGSSGASHGSSNSEITEESPGVEEKALLLPQDCHSQAEVGAEKNLDSVDLQHAEKLKVDEVVPNVLSNPADDASSVNALSDASVLPQDCHSQAEVGSEKNLDSADLQHAEKLKVDEVVPDVSSNPADNASSANPDSKEAKTTTAGKKKVQSKKEVEKPDWDKLRRKYSRPRSSDHTDTLDWEAVRKANTSDIAEIIKARGQHNIIADRIKAFLNRLVELHGSIDLEWLRYAPPMLVKKYLLDVEGLGLKSVECTRLLELGHVAFPVDVNVARIAVRLGWVPLKPLPGDLQFHLLEEYPIMDTVQKYLWPRLCEFDSLTLYEFHYHLITFGKIFCKKRNPNCGSCPMRPDCKHFASAVAASTNLNLPAPAPTAPTSEDMERSMVPSVQFTDSHPLSDDIEVALPKMSMTLLDSGVTSEHRLEKTSDCVPTIEEPKSPEFVQNMEVSGGGSEDDCYENDVDDKRLIDCYENDVDDKILIDDDDEEIPTIVLSNEEFRKNVQYYLEKKWNIQEHGGNASRALVPLSLDVNSTSVHKLKRAKHLRTEHEVYEVPDDHEILIGLERRDPEDSVPYLLAIWTAGETPNSVQQPQKKCNSEGTELCMDETCFACQSVYEERADIVRGTILIPCRTAMRARFPLNGTYFQVNEVFADHETSCIPLIIPRSSIWNLRRRTVFFGTSPSAIFTKDCSLLDIQRNFWKGFICLRGFDRKTRGPKPLAPRFHCSPSKMEKTPRKVPNPNNKKKKTAPKEKWTGTEPQGVPKEKGTGIEPQGVPKGKGTGTDPQGAPIS
ncbi:protein ROS1C-like isoform X2 [Euphorbia lathyris]|uniref:protein ROS1C-like isoform X2 n=1 Tax=Euphorbia lathyris TaxID=212925 RepID=UPI0033139EB0